VWPAIVKPAVVAIIATMAIAASSSASALCIYDGVDNAKTTLRQEFADSKWVVRAKVMTARDHWSDTEDSWTAYRLLVKRAYKGQPRRELTFFTYRDSGGFYLDRPWVSLPKGHDVGGEYLLFLNPNHRRPGEPARVEGTVFVNYSCGVSKPWRDATASEKQALERLASSRALIRPASQATFSRKGRRIHIGLPDR
jgi:hypothetical protein